jgi:hypothetical protein
VRAGGRRSGVPGIPDDLAALARTYRADVVVAMLDPQDVAAAAAPAWRSTATTHTLDGMLRSSRPRGFVVLDPPCALGDQAGRARLTETVHEWAARHRVGVDPADPRTCPATGRIGATTPEVWHALADVSGSAGP